MDTKLGVPNALRRCNSPGSTLFGSKDQLQDVVSPPDSSTPTSSNETLGGERTDILVVDWDGPDDPKNPRNWSLRRKWAVTVIVSAFAFISTVSSSMIAPASPQLAAELGISNSAVIALTTTILLLGYAFGPLFLGPLSEIYGRSRVLQLSNVFFLVWNLACGFSQNVTQILVFRFLSGLGGSAYNAIGGGVMGDCWRAEERGKAVAVFFLAPILGPVLGPIAGAWIAERSTWKWVFWSTTVADVVILIVGIIYMRETYAPVILQRKAAKMGKSMDMEKVPCKEIRTIFYGKQDRSWKGVLTNALIRPFALFAQEPIIMLLGIYMAYLYGLMYIFFTTMPAMFVGVYRQEVGIAGLHYISFGIGLLGASQLNSIALDKVYAYLKDKNGGVGKPEFRLPVMVVGTLLTPLGLLITGWSVQARVHWIVPDIGIMLLSAGTLLNFQCIQTYIVDAFTLYAASAMASTSFLRSLAGCGFPLFAPLMYASLGFGKGDTVLAAAAILIGCPAPLVFWYFGERIRKASRFAQ